MEDVKSYYAVIPANVRYDKNIPDKAKLLYGEITALCNEKGFCWASNEYFANLYDVRKETISRLVSSLEKNGYIRVTLRYKEGTKAIDSRCISIATPIDREINTYCEKSQEPHDKNVNTPIDENVKDNNTVFNNTINNRKDIAPFDIKQAFELFWDAYPKKMDKKKAQEKFMKICKNDEMLKDIMKGLEEHKKSVAWKEKNGQYIPHAKTWLNGERWNDEVLENTSIYETTKELPKWYYDQDSVKTDSEPVDEAELERLMKQMEAG